MTGTKNDRGMTGVLYGGVWEIWGRKHIFTATVTVSSLLKIFLTQLFLLFDCSKFRKYLEFFSPFSYQVARERIIAP